MKWVPKPRFGDASGCGEGWARQDAHGVAHSASWSYIVRSTQIKNGERALRQGHRRFQQ